MPDDPKTFTQEDVDRLISERLKRESAKYADYDELKAKATKLDEAEQKNKSENQKLLERIEAAERKAAEADKRVGEAEANALRFTVAAAKGLTPAQAKRLTGTTREELEADADELLESFKPNGENESKQGGGSAPGKPKEDLRGGGDPTGGAVETDPRKLAESVPQR